MDATELKAIIDPLMDHTNGIFYMVSLDYLSVDGEHSSDRLVEPYSIREGGRSFFGWDIDGDPPGIRRFIISGITRLEPIDQTFTPRYPEEFGLAQS